MCLAIPACVEQLINENYAIVKLGGMHKEISLVLVEDVVPGDYVIVHVGFALQKLLLRHKLFMMLRMQLLDL